MQSGFDTSVQAQMAKESIAESIDRFISDPSYAISFYTRKAMAMWSDPTHCSLEFYSRNVYLNSEQSPLIWFLANPLIIRVIASFLKLFQVLIFLGSAVFAVSTGRKKEGSPAILLFLTFCGGYVFHIIWEAEPFYTLAYMVLLIPAGVAGIVALIKKITSINIKELSGKRFKIGSGAVYFIAGTAVFLFAVAGLGTIRTQLADGRSEYRDYFENDLNNSRNPAEPGIYNLIPASDDYKGNGIKVELIRYAGKYRIRLAETDQDMNAYLTYDDGRIRADWFSSDDKQEFTILKNRNGSYSICHGANKAMSQDPSKGGMVPGDFINYAFSFNTDPYDQFISEHPEMTWNLIP